MSQTAFGLLTIAIIFVTMGSVGIYTAWPDLKKILAFLKSKR
jgi:hypothetical protein